MRNCRVYILYIICFVIGFIMPIVVPLLKKDEAIILSSNPEKYEKMFLRIPSVALLDSINAHTISCLCNDFDYDNLIYYWMLKDSSFFRSDTNEAVSLHHSILSCFADSTQYYSPNKDMLEFSKNITDILHNQE